MNEDKSLPPDTPESKPDSAASSDAFPPQSGRLHGFWPRARWLLIRGASLLAGFFVFLLLLTASAGWYTSRSEFCRSCHIMEPYYVSWQESSHRDVPCIKCHFAPGFGEKVRGKMLGLVQLAKYVTRSEGPRPAAEIPDASCLRSGCHETRLLSGAVDFQGIPFDHTPHLEELRRDKQLRCTSCHSQIVQGEHMAVTSSTCFLCHFKEGVFNEGLGACTRCHQIPTQEFDLGGGTMFSHELAFQRGVDCINCHEDVIRGTGSVPHERCRVCHNRESDLARIDNHVFMHLKHVTEHKIDCTDCHLEIQHSLDADKIQHAVSDCAGCHPKHHEEQVEMFEGTGGLIAPQRPGGMAVTRVSCRTCHRYREVSATGDVLWKASAEVCAMCHEASATEQFEGYYSALTSSLDSVDAGIQDARTALESADLTADKKAELTKRLDDLDHDAKFLRVGNGIHNIHYADELTRTLIDRTKEACKELKTPEPEVTLPKAPDVFK
jgi:predicted CXXCH cytochrome family protein